MKGVTIIGVVGDVKSDGFDAPSVPHIYVPLGQFAPVNAVVFLRSKADAEHLGEAVRQEVVKARSQCSGAQHQHDGSNHRPIRG